MPVPGENIQSWSITAADNAGADPLINWAEGMPRADVNNSARSMTAAIAKWRNLQNGSIVTTGSANAQAFLSGIGYTATPVGLRALLKIGAGLTNTGPATLNMDGIGDVAVHDQYGTDLIGGSIVAGSYCEFVFDGTNWILLRNLGSLIKGVSDGSSAPAGYVGEYIENNFNTTGLPTGAWQSIGGVDIPAGDWDVSVNCNYTFPVTTYLGLCLLPALNSGSGDPKFSSFMTSDPPGAVTLMLPPMRITITVATTYYVNCYSGSPGAAANLACIVGRRVR